MPGLADIMNNPAIMGMAQQMMSNGGIERMMQNELVPRKTTYLPLKEVEY